MSETTPPYKSEAVTEETRVKAQEWLKRFQDEIQRLGYQWMPPWTIEAIYEDEILLNWDRSQSSERWLHFYIDKEEVRYFRSESRSAKADMFEGNAEDLEVCRLLWHWLWSENV